MLGVDGYTSRRQDGTTGYLFKNAHGDVVSAHSSTTNKIADYTYDAWGEQRTTGTQVWGASNPIRYNGQYYDTESGMTYLRARYYDSDIKRFISEDPAKDGLNWYAYAGNNPVMFVDPSGLDYDKIISALNDIYYAKNVMNDNESYTTEYGEAYELAMNAKNTIANEVEYYENWGGIADAISPIIDGGNNSLDDIKNAITYVQNAEKKSIRQDKVDDIIYYSVATITVTAAIRGGKVLAGANTSNTVFNFSSSAARHMSEAGRHVPIQILQLAIKYGNATPDPQGSSAIMYYIDLYTKGSDRVLEVLYDKATNTILHFLYK